MPCVSWVLYSVISLFTCPSHVLHCHFTECGSCYQIGMGSVVAIIACDIILTVLITISVLCFATFQKRRREWDPHEVQSDVYSDLQHLRQ
uniref:TYRO protein tyrosine kinase-binding protein n=1 Tax=Myripristis murdjan TaxID=586833 RepID=A0A667XU05_9TELE